MKKYTAMFLMLFAAVLLFMIPARADAASLKMKTLKKGKTYKIDLNGGKKEKVKYNLKKVNNSTQRFTLYVNGKAVYKKDVDEYAMVASVKTVDIVSKDKYTEILVDVGGSSSDWWVFILRYKSKKKVTAYTKFSNIKGEMCPLDIGRIDSENYKNTGKNKLYLQNETPFNNANFGCYYILAPISLKNGKMKAVTDSKYKLTRVKEYTPDLFGGKYYKLKRSMTLYKSASFEKPLKTLYAYDTFVPTYIKPLAPESETSYGYTSYRHPLFVKVKASDGTTGWLYFPANSSGSGSDYLTATPAWG